MKTLTTFNMKNIFLITFGIFILAGIIIFVFSFHTFNTEKITNSTIIHELRDERANVMLTNERTNQGIFSIEAQVITINGEQIDLYQYPSSSDLFDDASSISQDGGEFNKGHSATQMDWVTQPHFYKKDNIMAVYIGTNTTIELYIKQVFGSQFAGK